LLPAISFDKIRLELGERMITERNQIMELIETMVPGRESEEFSGCLEEICKPKCWLSLLSVTIVSLLLQVELRIVSKCPGACINTANFIIHQDKWPVIWLYFHKQGSPEWLEKPNSFLVVTPQDRIVASENVRNV